MSCDPPHSITSGIYRQKKSKDQAAPGAHPDTKEHDFATPRVKSAAKSRKAVTLLNSIVDTKDDLLKEAIVSMDHKARNHLISKNNDFIKFVSAPSPTLFYSEYTNLLFLPPQLTVIE